MIKAVVFDLGEVILDWRTPFQNFLNQFDVELDAVLQACRDDIIAAELGKISADELCQRVMARLGHVDQWPKLRKIMPADFILRQETLALIKELRGRYRLALLTNLELGQLEEIDKIWGLKQYFDVIADSSKLKIRKPDERIFTYVLKQLALPARECLFIDDVLVNIKAAKKLGFQTVHFTDPEESVKLVRKILYGKI